MLEVIHKGNVRQEYAHDKESVGNVFVDFRIKAPALGQACTVKAFKDKAHETAGYIENGFQFTAFTGCDCGSTFGSDHAEEILTELSVKNECIEGRMEIAAEDECGKCRQVKENVGKRIKHFSKITYFVIFTGIVAVKVIGELCKGK